MIPRDKRRTIVVNDNTYEYAITGYVSIFIKNLKTKNIVKKYIDVKSKWKTQVLPSQIRKIIEEAKI